MRYKKFESFGTGYLILSVIAVLLITFLFLKFFLPKEMTTVIASETDKNFGTIELMMQKDCYDDLKKDANALNGGAINYDDTYFYITSFAKTDDDKSEITAYSKYFLYEIEPVVAVENAYSCDYVLCDGYWFYVSPTKDMFWVTHSFKDETHYKYDFSWKDAVKYDNNSLDYVKVLRILKAQSEDEISVYDFAILVALNDGNLLLSYDGEKAVFKEAVSETKFKIVMVTNEEEIKTYGPFNCNDLTSIPIFSSGKLCVWSYKNNLHYFDIEKNEEHVLKTENKKKITDMNYSLSESFDVFFKIENQVYKVEDLGGNGKTAELICEEEGIKSLFVIQKGEKNVLLAEKVDDHYVIDGELS